MVRDRFWQRFFLFFLTLHTLGPGCVGLSLHLAGVPLTLTELAVFGALLGSGVVFGAWMTECMKEDADG